MDWITQSQELTKSWTDAQTKTWETWFKSLQDNDKLEPAQMWNSSIDAWQASVKNMLSTQVEGSRIWVDSILSMKGAPEETGEWAKQMQDMAKNWTDLQQQMWDNWFDAVKNADPSKFMSEWNVEGSPLMSSWQDMTKKILDTQSQWAETLTPQKPEDK